MQEAGTEALLDLVQDANSGAKGFALLHAVCSQHHRALAQGTAGAVCSATLSSIAFSGVYDEVPHRPPSTWILHMQ